MNKEQMRNIRPGDVVRNKADRGHAYIVHCNYGNRITAVRTADITNHEEWELVEECSHKHIQIET